MKLSPRMSPPPAHAESVNPKNPGVVNFKNLGKVEVSNGKEKRGDEGCRGEGEVPCDSNHESERARKRRKLEQEEEDAALACRLQARLHSRPHTQVSRMNGRHDSYKETRKRVVY